MSEREELEQQVKSLREALEQTRREVAAREQELLGVLLAEREAQCARVSALEAELASVQGEVLQAQAEEQEATGELRRVLAHRDAVVRGEHDA